VCVLLTSSSHNGRWRHCNRDDTVQEPVTCLILYRIIQHLPIKPINCYFLKKNFFPLSILQKKSQLLFKATRYELYFWTEKALFYFVLFHWFCLFWWESRHSTASTMSPVQKRKVSWKPDEIWMNSTAKLKVNLWPSQMYHRFIRC
jgi:hypothetical protein